MRLPPTRLGRGSACQYVAGSPARQWNSSAGSESRPTTASNDGSERMGAGWMGIVGRVSDPAEGLRHAPAQRDLPPPRRGKIRQKLLNK